MKIELNEQTVTTKDPEVPGYLPIEDNVPAVIWIPSNAIELKMTATVYIDGKIKKAETTFDTKDIREMMNDGHDWEEEFAKYELTDEGREYLKSLMGDIED